MYYSYGKVRSHDFHKNNPVPIFGKILHFIANYHLNIEFEWTEKHTVYELVKLNITNFPWIESWRTKIN